MSRNARNINLNIVDNRVSCNLNIIDNSVSCILVSILKHFKYGQFSSLQTMSVIHKYLVIYLSKYHEMNKLISSIQIELMTRKNAHRWFQIDRRKQSHRYNHLLLYHPLHWSPPHATYKQFRPSLFAANGTYLRLYLNGLLSALPAPHQNQPKRLHWKITHTVTYKCRLICHSRGFYFIA